jgi:uncharacterized Ntn-hydrolase superfamily protein
MKIQTMRTLFTLLALSLSINTLAQFFQQSNPFAHTYSIVARDEKTGDLGIAVQSHWFSVGTVVAWGESGVGVVATQSFVNKSFGPKGIALLRNGKSAENALQELIREDSGRNYRQLAILDKNGNAASYTGSQCITAAGHRTGLNYSVQANMMLNDKVVPAMEQAWLTSTALPLAERLVTVLQAAEKAGGDIRGKQSAALLVVSGEASNEPWNDRKVDLRVDDSKDPIAEIARLLRVHRAYESMNEGDLQIEKGEIEKAMIAYNKAMKQFPDNLEMQYWTAISLANKGKLKQAQQMLAKIYRKDANWRELTRRLPAVGLLTVTESQLKTLLQ